MEPFRYHIFVCDQRKAEGAPCCSACGSGAVIEALRSEVTAQGLFDSVQITVCGSLGLCEHGPNMIVYPEGVWYSGLTVPDVAEIVRSHLRDETVVERLARLDIPSLRAEILANRERAQAAMRAKDASGALPDDLVQTIRGFQESRVILTAIELDIFTALGSGSTAEEVSRKLGTGARAAEMLLNALVAMAIIEERSGIFRNSAMSARYLVAGSPNDSRAALMHNVHLWKQWSTLTDCVRTGTSVVEEETGDRDEYWTRAFIAAMDQNARERASVVAGAVPLAGVRKMLDVGGGSAAYSIAFARASEKLLADVFDLPFVAGLARDYIAKAGLTERIQTRSGDLLRDPLGTGYDLVFVSAICHMLSPAENLDLLRKCHAALSPGGLIVIQDFILEAGRTAPRFAVLFSLNMLVNTRAGSSYSEEDYSSWLRDSGFQNVRRIRLPGPTGLMLANSAAG